MENKAYNFMDTTSHVAGVGKWFTIYRLLVTNAKDHLLFHRGSRWKVAKMIHKMCQEGYVYEVTNRDGVPIGYFASMVVSEWWSEEYTLEEIFVLSMPHVIGFGHIAANWLTQIAVLSDCHMIQAGSMLSVSSKLTANSYLKSNYCSYHCFYKEII